MVKKAVGVHAHLPHVHETSTSSADFIYLIPKFHLPVHIPSCHTKYSFYKTLYMSEMDGEAPEHRWSQLNPLMASLKVMGPGDYLNMLDNPALHARFLFK